MASTITQNVIISIRLPSELIEKLDRLAAWQDRSRSYLASRAIEDFVERESQAMAAVEDGLEAIDRGEVLPHSDVKPWLQKLERGEHARPPRPKKR